MSRKFKVLFLLFVFLCIVCLLQLALQTIDLKYNLSVMLYKRKEEKLLHPYFETKFKGALSLVTSSALQHLVSFDEQFGNKSDLKFDVNSSDVIVVLHIQKTGGSNFNLHLVYDMNARCFSRHMPKRKFHVCYRPNEISEWIFSRFTSKQESNCGIHPEWTTLTQCVPDYYLNQDPLKRYRYFYITTLRDPIRRYLSEWGHVRRGATWQDSYLICNNRLLTYTHCWKGSNWKGVTLNDFLACPNNVANNRMTRMLSDMHVLNCSGTSNNTLKKNKILLQSAKENLKNMPFFGINEKQKETQYMFEKTFGVVFNQSFQVKSSSHYEVTPDQLKMIRQLNYLDIQLYDYALKIFGQRYAQIRQLISEEQNRKMS